MRDPQPAAGTYYSPAGGTVPAAYHRPAYTNPRFMHPVEELNRQVVRWTAGYRRAGSPIRMRLEQFQPLRFQIRRRHCYAFVIRLLKGAQFSDHAKRGVGFKFVFNGRNINAGPGIYGPGGVARPGCAYRDGQGFFDIRAYFGSARDPSRIHELGQGPFVVQMYVKRISERELADKLAARRRAILLSRLRQREMARAACLRCKRRYMECLDGRHRPFGGSCLREFDSCVSRSYLRRWECR